MSELDGCVFLSWRSFGNWYGKAKLHLDGGVTAGGQGTVDDFDSAKKVVFYSGTLNAHAGIDLLLDAFEKIGAQEIELWICGKGENQKVRKMAKADARIKYFGCVSEARLHSLCQKASVMVNPRPSRFLANRNNFPSKLLEYLSYGKPVVSTFTPGIHPEYIPYLKIPAEETPDAMASAIMEVLAWPRTQVKERAEETQQFLAKSKSWKVQATRLVSFLESVVSNH